MVEGASVQASSRSTGIGVRGGWLRRSLAFRKGFAELLIGHQIDQGQSSEA